MATGCPTSSTSSCIASRSRNTITSTTRRGLFSSGSNRVERRHLGSSASSSSSSSSSSYSSSAGSFLSFPRSIFHLVVRIHAVSTLLFLTPIARTLLLSSIPIITVDATAAAVERTSESNTQDCNKNHKQQHRHHPSSSSSTSNPISRSRLRSIQFGGNPFDADWDDTDNFDLNTVDVKPKQHDDDEKKPNKQFVSWSSLSSSRSCRRGGDSSFFGFGREFSLFRSVPCGGGSGSSSSSGSGSWMASQQYSRSNFFGDDDDDDDSSEVDYGYEGRTISDDDGDADHFFRRMERYRERRKSISSISSGGFNNNNNEGYSFSRGGRPPYTPPPQQQQQRRRKQQHQKPKPRIIRNAQNWWKARVDPKLQSLPQIVCRIEPSTTLKLRKTFRPLKTIVRLGADYNTQQGIWQFKSSWEDAIIGGKITLSGNKELQLTKSWQMSVGGVEDLVTRLRFRATINLQTFQAYAKVGFRTERFTPIDVVEGFTVLKRMPLDGIGGNLKLEVKANVALPEPEIEYRTESQARSLTGMGDIEVSIDELNLLLDY
mmetsp:Transcript_15162/g.31341  ORF Transcript_15162/g.31341 Transcript_15162/m.31341 type:complete len:544 (-) Transcript_15162:151-1782(-)